MNWERRWRTRRALSLALQRIRYICTPWRLRLAFFLRRKIAWERIGMRRGDLPGLAGYSRMRKTAHVKHLLDPDDLAWFKQNDPYRNHSAILAHADMILRHQILLHGYRRVDFGAVIDWDRDPVSGTRFPDGLFSVLPDPKVDGRFRTELNLHRHLPVLAIAWLLTSRPCYAVELGLQLDQWIHSHPPLDDTFINDGLEDAARLFCWTHCLGLMADAPVSADVRLRVLWAIHEACVRIERNCDAARLPNNHQVAEAFALFFVGLLYPELKESPAWFEKGLDLLKKNLEIQFLPGGVHAEQSTNYHLFVLEIYLITLLLCDRNRISLPANFKGRVEQAAEYIFYLMKPDSSLPNIGDTGMKFFCPTGDSRFYPPTYLALGGRIFGRPEMASVAGGWPHEAFWIAGRPATPASSESTNTPALSGRKVWKEAGHIVIRSGWSPGALYFHFDFGPQGHGPMAGHSHDDALSVELHALGETFIVDPGTYTYVRSHRLREYFCGARGHNTILVDGKGPAVLSAGPFGWTRTVHAQLTEFGECPELVWFTACHDAFTDSSGPVVVERSVLVAEEHYVLLLDRVHGQGRRRIEFLLHFKPEINTKLSRDVLQCSGICANLTVCTASSGKLEHSIHSGEDEVQPGWYSPGYNSALAAPVLRSFTDADLPFWKATALFPMGRATFPPAVVRLSEAAACIQGDGPRPVALEIVHGVPDQTDTLVVSEAPGSISIAGIVTDARMLVLRQRGAERHAWTLGARSWRAQDGLTPCAIDCSP
jgi:hypothetical protein